MPARLSLPRLLVLTLFATLTMAATASAQPGPGGGGGGGGPGGPGGGPGGPPNPEEMRQMLDERLKDQLDVTDDEFTKLSPMIEQVRQLQRDANARFDMRSLMRRDNDNDGGGGPGGGPGGPGGGPGGPPDERDGGQPTAVQSALKDLRALTQQKEVAADTVQAKLKALRDARTKAKTDLTAAQDGLRKAVNARQEVVLITLGLLE